jgi:hypothetical protein
MAQLEQSKGATQEAVNLLERVVSQTPDFRSAHVLLARLYYKLKRTADAERERVIIDKLNAEEQQTQQMPGKPQAQPSSDKNPEKVGPSVKP